MRKLRHVVGVADAESFTSAASSLSVSQSAVTKSVSELEHRLGIKLFLRLQRGVRLTEAGELFVERARQILADTDDLMSGVDNLRSLRTGRLRLGVAPAAFVTMVDEAVAAFAKLYPGVRIEVLETDVEQTARLLSAGRLEVVVGEANYLAQWNEISTESVAELHNCLIARPDHPLRQCKRIEAQDLLSYPLVAATDRLPTEAEIAGLYVKAGLSPIEPQFRCNSSNLVRKLVLNTDAVAPLVTYRQLGTEARNTFFVMEDIVGMRQHVLGLATASDRDQAPAVMAFRDIFKKFQSDSVV